MNPNDQIGPSNWKDIIKGMNDESRKNPDAFLKQGNINIDESLISQVNRLQNLEMNKEKIEMWHDLKALVEGQLEPEDRRAIICKLAERYQGFIGWEGDTKDEPGW